MGLFPSPWSHSCPACEAQEAACEGQPALGRRGLFAAAVGGVAAASLAAAGIRRVQTGENFHGVYWRDGRYETQALRQLDWVLRDPGMEEATPMDPRLFDVLAAVQTRMGSDENWLVISGYRAPETNAARARQSRRVSRVSLHMSGMAADVQLPGRASLQLARVAAEMQLGGVGLYRRDGFIHLDCGPTRRW
ncbi:MAG: DUF882 domain-containing protein [Alphaproteobacteria bacterium]|nr:DUF882 domain-containing protein [Alphaproteobacteria bacterium]